MFPPPVPQMMIGPSELASPPVRALRKSWFSITVSMRQSFGRSSPILLRNARGSLRYARTSRGVDSQKWRWNGSSRMIFETAEKSTIFRGMCGSPWSRSVAGGTRSYPSHPSRHPERDHVVGDVPYHRRAGADDRARADAHVGGDGGAQGDEGFFADAALGADGGAGGDVGEVADDGVMIDGGLGVEQDAAADG